jgi:ORF6N domain
MFQLSAEELEILRSHSATSSWGGRRHAPYAFTEHGAIMAAMILNSRHAVEMSVYVVRAADRLHGTAREESTKGFFRRSGGSAVALRSWVEG